MNESINVVELAILIAIVRYQHENTLLENFLLHKSLPTFTSEVEIFGLLNCFLEENKIPRNNCIGICADRANAMGGTINGPVQLIKNVAKNSHYMIHRQAHTAKELSPNHKIGLDEVVKVINFINLCH